MARPFALTAIQGGVNRQRVKGAARQNVLYDLVNGYVSDDKTVVVRPGSIKTATLPAGTKGLTSFNGELHVFAVTSLEVPDGYVLHVITHPDQDGSAINRIWFAEPYMGFLYVVADFVGHSGEYWHYWLQTGDEWAASHTYKHGDVIVPSTPNGFSYQASRLGAPNLSWAPGVQRTVGDVIEPTVYNDFQYEVIDTLGTNPRSGDTEPEWPLEDGAQISEDADGLGNVASGDTTETPDNDTTPNPDTV
jgi:hypothetical protein